MNWLKKLIGMPGAVLVLMVRFYQRGISPMFGPKCRFTPSCSEYYIQSVKKHGAIRGSLRGMWRIMKCHPFHPGGYDPP